MDHQKFAARGRSRRRSAKSKSTSTGSGLTYTILHPSLFMESWLGPKLFADPAVGTATVYGDGTHKSHYVAVADVVELAVQSVDNFRCS